jgi:hypothetical protein
VPRRKVLGGIGSLRAFLLLVILFSATLVGSLASTPVVAQPVSSSLLQQKTQLACSFLKNLYNPTLQLVRTTPTSNVYYVASDNLLAVKALSSCAPTIGQAINQSINSCCSRGYDDMHETLLGASIHLPINNAATYIIANSTANRLFRNITPTSAGGNYTVFWQIHNSTGALPDCTYADVAVYTALELKREANTTGGQHQMDCLALMFDGRGLVDESYKDGTGAEHGIYQTYKLALYLYALQTRGSYFYGEEDTLLRSQGPDGGFHSGYGLDGTYAGTQENAETTLIAMIAIAGLSTTSPFSLPLSFSIPPAVIYFFIGLAAVAVVILITVFIMEQKRRKRVFPKLAA